MNINIAITLQLLSPFVIFVITTMFMLRPQLRKDLFYVGMWASSLIIFAGSFFVAYLFRWFMP